MARRSTTVWVAGLLWWSTTATAHPVPEGYQRVAIEFGVPPALLYAVALTESGQSALSGGQFRPWPWTLNINGKGHYYPSRQAAWRALTLALNAKDTSVDVGLMQVNWRYHHSALGSSWQALDPYHNLRVAAALLHDCLSKHIHWIKSVGCYHAPNDSARAGRYGKRVEAQAALLTGVHWEVDRETQ